MNAIQSVMALSNTGSKSGSVDGRSPSNTLDQDDFLKLLVAKMTTQDPMSPTGDSDMFTQMATFSSLEQTRSMEAKIGQLRNDQLVLQANSLLGRTVDVKIDAATKTSGTVRAVHMEAGTPKVEVNGKLYDLGQVLLISPSPVNPQLS